MADRRSIGPCIVLHHKGKTTTLLYLFLTILTPTTPCFNRYAHYQLDTIRNFAASSIAGSAFFPDTGIRKNHETRTKKEMVCMKLFWKIIYK